MTRFYQFVPNVQAPFTFQPKLDNQQYTARVVWNLYGQRWYLDLTELNGTPVFSLPLIGSPDGVGIDSATWDTGTVTLVTSLPHNYTRGQTVAITISGFLPVEYNGAVLAYVIDANTLQYPLTQDPGDATQLGSEIYNINIAGGYFTDSILVYRESSQTFEVSP